LVGLLGQCKKLDSKWEILSLGEELTQALKRNWECVGPWKRRSESDLEYF
jgi:hypothetical protein